MTDPTLPRDTEIYFLMLAVFYHDNDDDDIEGHRGHIFDTCPAKTCTDHRAILARLRAEKGEA